MMGKTLGWLGLTVGKPQGRSLCVWGVASNSAASHPNPGSSGMVEFSEESRRDRGTFYHQGNAGGPNLPIVTHPLASASEVTS